MGRHLSQLLLLVRSQIRLDVLGVASDQVNSRRDHHVRMINQGDANASMPSIPISSVASALNFGSCRTVILGRIVHYLRVYRNAV